MSLTKVSYSMISGAPANVLDFGAVGDGVTDDTVAIQSAIDFVIAQPATGVKTLYFPDGDYSVTTISFAMPSGSAGTVTGCTFLFNGTISGKSSGNHSSVVEVMAGYSKFVNMRVNGNNNDGNLCGIHWYTNDISKNYPGYVQFENCTVTQCFIGMCIGMLPSQAGVYYGPSAVVAKPLAIDAPVSESFVHGMTFEYCLKSVVMEQPNGKLTFTDCTLGGNNTTFPSYTSAASPLDLNWGELSMIGGSLENVWVSSGKLANIGRSDAVGSVTFNMNGVVMESICPIIIFGNSTVRISQNCNWGVNLDSEFFWVHTSATQELIVTDSFLLRGQGSGFPAVVVKTVVDLNGSNAVNYNFWSNFTNTRFQNCIVSSGGSSYQPLVKGTRAKYSNCYYTILNSGGTRTSALKLNPLTNMLSGKVDLAAGTITAYGANGNATSGGWSFSVSSGASSWGRNSSGLPTIVGTPVSYSLKATSGSGGGGNTVSFNSPKFYVEPGRMYLITGFILASNTATIMYVRAKFFDFSGSATSPGFVDLFNGLINEFYVAGNFVPFELYFQAPGDATQCEMQIYGENGAEMQFFNLNVS